MSLIGVEGGNATRISRFANYLRNLLPSSDPVVMEMASKAMGHLSMAGDTFTAEYVEFEVKRALEWLGADRNEGRRHAAVSHGQTTRTVCCVNRLFSILKLSLSTFELHLSFHELQFESLECNLGKFISMMLFPERIPNNKCQNHIKNWIKQEGKYTAHKN